MYRNLKHRNSCAKSSTQDYSRTWSVNKMRPGTKDIYRPKWMGVTHGTWFFLLLELLGWWLGILPSSLDLLSSKAEVIWWPYCFFFFFLVPLISSLIIHRMNFYICIQFHCILMQTNTPLFTFPNVKLLRGLLIGSRLIMEGLKSKNHVKALTYWVLSLFCSLTFSLYPTYVYRVGWPTISLPSGLINGYMSD